MFANLELNNFRSYKHSEFTFDPKINIITGPNTSGKTNLIEALLLLARGKSYRAKDPELVRLGQDWARLDTQLTNNDTRQVKLSLTQTPLKLLNINNQQFMRMSLKNTLPVVIFEPNHLQILSGGPDGRRNYIDDLLEQTTTGYTSLRRQYQRALTQRNRLLKDGFNKNQIFPWNIKLSELAGKLVKQRMEITETLNKSLRNQYDDLAGTKDIIEIKYGINWPVELYETKFLEELEKNLDLDKIRGFTSSGPHRENFIFKINGRDIQAVASRGETRSVLLAIKIIELKIIEEARDQKPILLLDDVFGELDHSRRHGLVNLFNEHQVFITTTDADMVSKNFTNHPNIIALKL